MDELDVHPDALANNLPEAVDIILEMGIYDGNICRFSEY
jgi:hypothetical protein